MSNSQRSASLKKVQIYHYEPHNKFFIGTQEIDDRRPNISLPAFSTDIKPSLELLVEGQIPIFNGSSWDLVEDVFWRPKWIECNYDAGRKTDTYTPLHLSMYSKHFASYPSIPMLCNTFLVTQAICQRVRLVHDKFNSLLILHKSIISGALPQVPVESPKFEEFYSSPSELYRYKLDSEAMVYLMRRVLDSLVQLTYLLTNYEDFERTKSMPISELGKVIKETPPVTNLEKIIIGDGIEYERDETGFLAIINSVFNSFKHCFIHDETYHIIGATIPTIVSYQAKHNKYDGDIIFHNHNAIHIMMGFQDTLIRILKNQRKYQMCINGEEE